MFKERLCWDGAEASDQRHDSPACLMRVFFPCFRVVGVIGVEVGKEVQKPEPVLSGEDLFEDQNENSPLLH